MDDLFADTCEPADDDLKIAALVQRYVESDLNADELSIFNALLRGDARWRTLFVRQLTQEAYLAELLAQDHAASESPSRLPDTPTAPLALPSPDATSSNMLWRGASWGLIALLLLAMVYGGYRLTWAPPRAEDRDRSLVAQRGQPRMMVVGTVRLDSGTKRLTLPNVGDLIVDGPAELELVSPKRMVLSRGKVRIRVTEPEGKGFAVQTRDGEVTDLGTEFAMDVEDHCDTKLVVFDGAVDLRVADFDGMSTHLVSGEAITFTKGRDLARIVSIVTGTMPTFASSSDHPDSVIAGVSDNLQANETSKFYEIVPKGFREDVRAYVDRVHEWNGVDASGLPDFLVGADYVKTFNDDKLRGDTEIKVTLARPARLFVLFDERCEVPQWLKLGFRQTGDTVGQDFGPYASNTKGFAIDGGAGHSIDGRFSVWERIVETPSTVTLGPNTGLDKHTAAMYGIAAIPLESHLAPPSER